jgi:hypothetical protein
VCRPKHLGDELAVPNQKMLFGAHFEMLQKIHNRFRFEFEESFGGTATPFSNYYFFLVHHLVENIIVIYLVGSDPSFSRQFPIVLFYHQFFDSAHLFLPIRVY